MIKSIKGALMGVFVGDASGATLELMYGERTEEEAKVAMKMLGGGKSNVGPGQITDDSELAICLAWALQDGYDINKIALSYNKWYNSEPLDMGNTCKAAFKGTTSKEMIELSLKFNMKSESNGALMRIVPLAIYASQFDNDTLLIKLTSEDAQLSHPNPITVDCNILYSLAIAYLIRHSGDNTGCLAYLDDKLKQININNTVRQWYKDSAADNLNNIVNALHNIGHVKHAFILSFYYLRKKTEFTTAIKETLMRGGDTDTNAAIVGGMMGALHGYDAIPEALKMAVLEFDCCANGIRKRPDFVSAKHFDKLVSILVKQK